MGSAIIWSAVIGLLVASGYRCRGTPIERRGRAIFGAVGLGWWLFVQAWWLWPSHFDIQKSLPLHVCDLAGLLAPVVMLAGGLTSPREPRWLRPLRALLYFWAWLSLQAFITPAEERGLATLWYWVYWVPHAVILGAAAYDVLVGGFRPAAGDWVLAVGVTLLYVVAMFGLDISTGWNYGYVGQTTPERATLLDFLGEWPLRVLWMAMLGFLLFLGVWLPWAFVAPRGRKRP